MPTTEPATVLTVSRRGATVDLDDGTVLDASVSGKVHRADRRETNPVAVGDRVHVERGNAGQAAIVGVDPRKSVLLRPEVAGRWKRQVLVANADRAILVFALRDPPPVAGLVDRLLVACHAGNVPPLLVFNKSDLEPSPEARALVALYEGLGYEVVHTSAESGAGLDTLRKHLAGRCSVFAGPSGVGKSSLVNRALPGVRLRTGEISRVTGKGTHTTTSSCLVRIAAEPGSPPGHVIDTPGIKEFGLIGIAPPELDLHFPEFPVPGRCGFRDCRHLSEPGCAVRAAAASGAVGATRYESYRTFLTEVEADSRREIDGGGAGEGSRPERRPAPGGSDSGGGRPGPRRRGRPASR